MRPEATAEVELPEPDRLENEDISELFLAAHHAREAGVTRVFIDPAHAMALCLEVLRTRTAGKARS